MRKTLLFVLGTAFYTVVSAQFITPATINSTGQSYAKDNIQLEWSVGEMAVVETMTSGAYVISHGFLQPANLRQSGISNNFDPDEIKIRPNPTFNIVEISIFTLQQGNLRFQVYDAQGKSLLLHKAASNGYGHLEKIDLTRFASGTYLIKIDLDPAPGFVSKTGAYKIVKI